VNRHAGHDERDAEQLDRGRQLREHDDADDGRCRGQQRDEQRVSRAIASWSQTYGMTDDATPTPMPAAIAIGSSSAGTAFQPASGVTTTSAASIDAARPSSPLPCATRWLSTM
jgi:hypothetical protein